MCGHCQDALQDARLVVQELGTSCAAAALSSTLLGKIKETMIDGSPTGV
jgi:hypothetical protein